MVVVDVVVGVVEVVVVVAAELDDGVGDGVELPAARLEAADGVELVDDG